MVNLSTQFIARIAKGLRRQSAKLLLGVRIPLWALLNMESIMLKKIISFITGTFIGVIVYILLVILDIIYGSYNYYEKDSGIIEHIYVITENNITQYIICTKDTVISVHLNNFMRLSDSHLKEYIIEKKFSEEHGYIIDNFITVDKTKLAITGRFDKSKYKYINIK